MKRIPARTAAQNPPGSADWVPFVIAFLEGGIKKIGHQLKILRNPEPGPLDSRASPDRVPWTVSCGGTRAPGPGALFAIHTGMQGVSVHTWGIQGVSIRALSVQGFCVRRLFYTEILHTGTIHTEPCRRAQASIRSLYRASDRKPFPFTAFTKSLQILQSLYRASAFGPVSRPFKPSLRFPTTR